MTQTVDAIFDGKVLLPDTELKLEPNTRVRVTVELLRPTPAEQQSFLDTARSLNLEGPVDWSEKLDTYLYGDDQPRR